MLRSWTCLVNVMEQNQDLISYHRRKRKQTENKQKNLMKIKRNKCQLVRIPMSDDSSSSFFFAPLHHSTVFKKMIFGS